MNDTFQLIQKHKIVPVVAIHEPGFAVQLAAALSAGGLPLAEITLRTDCALDVIGRLSRESDFLVGAGTVLNRDQCQHALDSNAAFVVSPGLDDGVIELCHQNNVPCFPGVATATEVQRAFNMGLRVVKFFPAEPSGGMKMLKSLAGPFHQMRFMPTGGIDESNAIEYLSLPATFAVGGSWMVKPDLYGSGDFSQVESLTKTIVSKLNRLSQS